MRYLSLFSGIGGFEYAIQKVFPRAVCVGFSEIDKFAIQIYQQHFPTHPYLGPIQSIKGRLDIDLIVAGFPCNDLSSRNRVRKGLAGASSGLFYQFLRILARNRPCYYLIENVASMKTDQRDLITKELSRYGHTELIALDSDLCSAQSRKRYYWTNLPLTQLDVLKHMKCQSPTFQNILLPKSQVKHLAINKDSLVLKTLLARTKAKQPYWSCSVSESTREKSLTLLATTKAWVLDYRFQPPIYRKLHPVEAERLQTFPDNWTDGLSYSQQIKVLGNAVTCQIIIQMLKVVKRKHVIKMS